jgi:hypothetical protein
MNFYLFELCWRLIRRNPNLIRNESKTTKSVLILVDVEKALHPDFTFGDTNARTCLFRKIEAFFDARESSLTYCPLEETFFIWTNLGVPVALLISRGKLVSLSRDSSAKGS